MSVLFDITEGWTEPLDAQLSIDGSPFDATGMTIVAILKDKNGADVSLPVAWLLQTSSTARLTPSGSTFVAALSPYTLHYQVTDGGGLVAFCPQGLAAQVIVRRK